MNIHALDGKLAIKPQIGITNSSLLSGGEIAADGTQEGGNFADGVVPSLTVNYSGEKFEAEYYSGYYLAARGRDGDAALDFLHLWVNAGYKITNKVSTGAHYEWLENSRNTFPGTDGSTTYEWVGPYVQFSLDNGFFSRFTSGAEIQDGATGDFYKLTAGFSF